MIPVMKDPTPAQSPATVRLLVFIVGVALLTLGACSSLPPEAHRAMTEVPMKNIAHAGGHHERPDNTMEAYRHAAEVGADMLEIDLNLSADGVVMVIHDDRIDRYANGTGLVVDYTAEQLQEFDAAYWWPHLHGQARENREDRPDADFPYRGKGITFPTLDEVLAAFPDLPINMEIKPPFRPELVRATGETLRRHERTTNVIVAASDHQNMTLFRELFPEIPTSASQKEVIRFWLRSRLLLGWAHTMPAVAMQVPVRRGALTVVNKRFVTAAHRQGILVQPWTIDDVAEMERLLDMGVDGIMTNEVTALEALLQRRGER